jgi:hypothetical protein
MATLQLDMFTLADDAPTHTDAIYIGTCKACKRTQRTRLGDDYEAATRWLVCAHGCRWNNHPVHIEFHKMKVTYNPRVRCNAKCQTATGPVCECSCNGAHHGGRA